MMHISHMKNKKPLTLEKKGHETLTLGKKAARQPEKKRKKTLKVYRVSQKISDFLF